MKTFRVPSADPVSAKYSAATAVVRHESWQKIRKTSEQCVSFEVDPLCVGTDSGGTLLSSACDASAGSQPGGDPGPPKPGGTLTFAVASDAGCVDPQQVGSGDTFYSLRETVDSLTDQDPATRKTVPWLAQRWEVDEQAKSFTFHLRPGVTFSDGSPVNAQVVKDNFDAIPKLGALAILSKGYVSGYVGTEVIDDYTARITFEQPNAQFLQATSTAALGLVSASSAAKTPQQRCSDGVVGSRPVHRRAGWALRQASAVRWCSTEY
ncbi:ABC transporter substrate-binding protein [Nocardia gipuzkoensis]